MERIGETVKYWRELRGLSLRELADAAQCSKGHLSTLENSDTDPSATLLYRLSVALGVRMELLVKGAVEECGAEIEIAGASLPCELGKGHRDWHTHYGSADGQAFNLYWPKDK